MGKCKMKSQGGSRGRGRGRKRKCEDSDGSANEDVVPMKLKIRIGGHKLMKKKTPLVDEKEDEVPCEGPHCSIEEEVVNEEFVIDQLEGEHFEPDAGYFEEVVNNQEQHVDVDHDDDVGDDDDEEEDNNDDDDDGGRDKEERDEDDDDDDDDASRRVHRTKNIEWGEEMYNNNNNDDDEEDDDEDDDKIEHGDDLSDDEKKWLDALESGQLNENGEVKDPERSNVALTARQRALLYGEKIEELLELSSIQPTEMTEEQLIKRKKKALRRKQLEVEKTERDKKETLDRLLKKQDSRLKSCKNLPSKDSLDCVPCYRYLNNCKGIHVSVPQGFEFPLERKTAAEATPPIMCGVEGCTKEKKYNCSRTNIPLCSLECYRKNMTCSSHPSSIHLATV